MNRSQERAATREKRTPRGAARAKRRLGRALRRPPAVVADLVADLPGCPEHGRPYCTECAVSAVLS